MILNYVLGLSIFAALIVGAYSRSVTNQIHAVGIITDSVKAQTNAEAGVELGFHMLATSSNRQISAATVDLPLNDGRVAIRFENEAGKIDLNVASLDLISAGLSLLPLSTADKSDWLSALLRAREQGHRFASVDEMVDHQPVSNIPRTHWHRLFTVHGGVHFVNPVLANSALQRVLQQGGRRNLKWTGRAISGAHTVIAIGTSSDGARFIQSALFVPRPFQSPPYEMITYQQLTDDMFIEGGPPA